MVDFIFSSYDGIVDDFRGDYLQRLVTVLLFRYTWRRVLSGLDLMLRWRSRFWKEYLNL